MQTTSAGIQYVEPSSVKQIAGRAGRLSSNYKVGRVTAWQEVDLAYVRAVMAWDVPQIASAGIFPSVEQIALFSEHMSKLTVAEHQAREQAAQEGESEDGDDDGDLSAFFDAVTDEDVEAAPRKGKKKDKKPKPKPKQDDKESSVVPAAAATQAELEQVEYKIRLSKVLEKFVQLSRMDGRYHLCEHQGLLQISNWLHPIPLSIADRFLFANSPVNTRDKMSMVALYEFAAKYALKQPVALNIRLSKDLPKHLQDFEDLCVRHNILELYVWLANRFPKYFIELDLCQEQKNFAIKQIENTLMASTLQRNVTHEGTYTKNRRKVDATGNRLPAEEFPHIQASVKENLSKIPHELLVVVSDEANEGDGDDRNHYRRNASHGRRDNYSSQGSGQGRAEGRSQGRDQDRRGRGRGGPSAHSRKRESPLLDNIPRKHASAPTKATVASAPTVKAAAVL